MVTLSAKTNTFHQGVIPMNIVFVGLLSIAMVNVNIVTVNCQKKLALCAFSGSLTVKMTAILRSAEQARQRPGL